jgi:hypothetical protein
MPKQKESTSALSKLAARAVQDGKATPAEVRKLAASVLSQDETAGERPKKRRKAAPKKRAKKSAKRG